MQSSKQSGFTVAEVFIGVIVLAGASFIVSSQWQYSAATERDLDRKTAINAMHFYLAEAYPDRENGYPITISKDILKTVSENNLRDPAGRLVGEPASDLRYEPGDCTAGTCQRYTLRANLEHEADFIRKSE